MCKARSDSEKSPKCATTRREFFGQVSRAALGGSAIVAGWERLVEAAEAAGKTPRELLSQGDIIFEEGFENGISGYGTTNVECITSESESHSGSRCLKSHVPTKRQGNDIHFPVELDPDSLYHMEVWLRSDNRCGISVGVMKEWQDRRNITRFQNIPKRWTKFEVIFRQPAPDQGMLSVYMPNTWFGNTGTVWLDDIRIRRIATCKAEAVTVGEGYAETCALASTGPDSARLVWLSHVAGADRPLTREEKALIGKGAFGIAHAEGSDRLLCRAYTRSGWGPTQQLAEGLLFQPDIAANKDGDVCVVWTEKNDGPGWGIRCRMLTDAGWSKTFQVSAGPGSQWHPAVTSDGGRWFWCAWVSNAGGKCRIYLTPLTSSGPIDVKPFSSAEVNAYDPDAALDSDGRVWIAWHEFDGESYNVVARYVAVKHEGDHGTYRISGKHVIAASDLDEAHVTLTPDPRKGGGMWFAYDVGVVPKGRQEFHQWSVAQRAHMRMEIAHYREGKVTALYPPYGKWPENTAGELGQVVFDKRGNMWLVERAYNRHDDRHWDLSVRRYTGARDGWTRPRFISGARHGWGYPPAAASLSKGILTVWQSDTRQVGRAERHIGSSCLMAELVPTCESVPAEPKAGPQRPQKRDERMAFRAARPRHRIEYYGKKLYVFWGELHIHSRLSTCAGNRDLDPFDSYAYNRDYQDIDFMALTDHGGHMNHVDWFNVRKLASLQDNAPHFVAFSAQEWSSARVGYDGTGHKNIFYLTDDYARWYNPQLAMTPDELWKELAASGRDVFTVPHQLADGGGGPAFTDWSYHNEDLQPVAEIYQIRGSYEYLGCPWMSPSAMKEKGSFYQDGLALGHHLGVIASSDHGGGNGKAAVFAEKLDREHLFRAIQARRCYGSTNVRMLLDFRVNGHLMGEIISGKGRPREISCLVRSPNPLRQVVVFKNGKILVEKTPPLGTDVSFELEDAERDKDTDYYYLRAIQHDGQICWSSPVWVVG